MADALQELLGPVRAAVQQYDMIGENDRIAVGLSGGKDSAALLAALAALRRFYPIPFTLTAITLDPCVGGRETDSAAPGFGKSSLRNERSRTPAACVPVCAAACCTAQPRKRDADPLPWATTGTTRRKRF